ncbi:hypothetical protein JYK14_26455, partial [Siccirubricoccus sp. KC 17139]
MPLRVASLPLFCAGIAATLLTAAPAGAAGLAPGFSCGLAAPQAEQAAVQRIAARRHGAARRRH